jgi:predicted site-specific integrase-resolvase
VTEEKKGHVKITFEVEANEAFMDMMKDMLAKMPEMMAKMSEMRSAKKTSEEK